MRMARSLLIAGAALVGGAAATRADVHVSFNQPERFSDASPSGQRGPARERTLREIAAHLERLGTRYLKPGQTLMVEISDVDLAGRIDPWRMGADHLRILSGSTWPRIVLRYTLTQDGAPPRTAEETVADLDYQSRPEGRMSSDPLRYEKAMLDEWFRTRFGA